MQRLYRLGEEIIAGRSFAESLCLLQSALPGLMRATEIHVYVLDRASKTLQRIEVDAASGLGNALIFPEEPIEFRKKSVELCFRNRSSITVPDTRRSPLFDAAQTQHAPRSAMFVPMFAQEDLLGVLVIGDTRRPRQFSQEERVGAQHLANQIAIGMKLIEQNSLREQALGGDRLDTVRRLVSTAAGELKRPLDRILERSQSWFEEPAGASGTSAAREILQEARRATKILSRVLRFVTFHQEEEHLVDLAAALRGLVKLRQKAWEEGGIGVRDLLAPEPLVVATRSGILEQIISSLLGQAERSLEQSRDKVVTLRAYRLAATAQVDISWPGRAPDPADLSAGEGSPTEDMLSFAVCHDLIRAHGGQLRLASSAAGEPRFEVEFPLAQPAVMGSAAVPSAAERPLKPLTALVLEPDPETLQTLVSALADFGHRSVTASSGGEAAELVARLPFDVFFCSSHLPGGGWLECFENSRAHVRAFVLLTPGHDPALAAALPAGEARTLGKPVRSDELHQLLKEMEARGTVMGR